ncbi:DMT family transporter [Fluviispira vulneris]|uniref:DMT family transporter n=1 Tax=Fluviispira vulneris TaxID=2763012 RepID=UPI001647298D|nr:DMT family transporter [Fluviispira vulneris]
MGYAFLSLAAIFWGANYVVGDILVENINPIILSQLRWTLTAILLLGLYFQRIRNDFKLIKKDFRNIFFLAVFGQVLFPLCLYIGLKSTQPINAAIYLSATPALVLFLNRFVFKDFISRLNIVGVILSSFGVLYLVLNGKITELSQLSKINSGDIWAMGSAISWAFYCSFLRIKNKLIAGNSFVMISAVIAAIILVPITGYEVISKSSTVLTFLPTLGNIMGILFLVIFPSWLSYLFWSKGIAAIGATRGEIFTHLVPLSAAILSILFLNQQMHSYHYISAIFIVLGIILCSRKN